MNDTNPKPRAVPRIVVVGSINMDLVSGVSRLPRPGETVTGSDFQEIPGGKGANQAVAAARLGASTVMLGCVGDDAIGRRLHRSLKENHVEIGTVRTAVGTSSGVALITIDACGENTITVIPGANGQLGPADVVAAEASLKVADAILVQLEIPLETVAIAIAVARQHNVRVILDPAPAGDNVSGDLLQVDILCPNAAEAQQLTGVTINSLADASEAVARLAERGVGMPVITLGAQGAVFVSDGRVHHVDSFPVDVVDTTGAGDAFAAALAVALIEGRSHHAAIRFACAAGAIATSRMGAQPAMPSRQEVDSLN
jgi:ribokinase